MLKLFVVLILSAAAFSELGRETPDDSRASGDSQNGSDFFFTDDKDYVGNGSTNPYEEELSGSGDGETTVPPQREGKPSYQPLVNDNNEISQLRNKRAETSEEHPSNVPGSHTRAVLGALTVAGAVGFIFAILPILLIKYRMKKRDEGSDNLRKKSIYKKAPTTEAYV